MAKPDAKAERTQTPRESFSKVGAGRSLSRLSRACEGSHSSGVRRETGKPAAEQDMRARFAKNRRA